MDHAASMVAKHADTEQYARAQALLLSCMLLPSLPRAGGAVLPQGGVVASLEARVGASALAKRDQQASAAWQLIWSVGHMREGHRKPWVSDEHALACFKPAVPAGRRCNSMIGFTVCMSAMELATQKRLK